MGSDCVGYLAHRKATEMTYRVPVETSADYDIRCYLCNGERVVEFICDKPHTTNMLLGVCGQCFGYHEELHEKAVALAN